MALVEDTSVTLASPERGFFQYTETHYRSDNTGHVALNATTLASDRVTYGRTLVFRYYFIEKYRSLDTIDPTYLALVAADLTAARTAGVKLILRFAYADSGTTAPYNSDTTPTRVLGHIQQLAATLNAAADVIYAVEAGFIGTWGEWYYSDNFTVDPTVPGTLSAQNWTDRSQVIWDLLARLDDRIFILVRYAGVKLHMFGNPAVDSRAGRVGFHDDAFLASSDDYGTFGTFTSLDEAGTKAYMAAEAARPVPVGGESAVVNAPRSQWTSAAVDLAAYRWGFLNPLYHPDVLASWGGNIDTAKLKLGYRLVATAVRAAANAVAGTSIAVEVDVRNDGYSGPVNNRPITFVLDDRLGHRTETVIATDFRSLTPGTTTLTATVPVPAGTPAGTYQLALFIPDATTSLAARPEYSVRLANTGTWDSTRGYNALATVAVTAPAPPPVVPFALPAAGSTGWDVALNAALSNLNTRVGAGTGGGATTLDGLTDVTATTPSNGQVLQYSTSTGLWTNQTIAAVSSQNVLVTVTADGSTNAAPAIQSVLDALSSSAHSYDVVVEGTTKGPIYLNSKVRITTSDTTVRFKAPVLLGTGIDPDGEGGLSVTGTVGGSTTISSGAVRGSSKVVVGSATGITATKLVRVFDNDSSGGGSAGDKAEMAEVVDVSGTTIYLDRPLAHTYSGTVTLEYINAVTNSGFDGVTATFSGQQAAAFVFPAKMKYVRNCFFRNMHFKGTRTNSWSRECINVRNAYRCVVQNCTTSFSWDYNVNSTYCYGMSGDCATECQWVSCYTNNLRHGFTVDKGSTGCEYTSCHAGNALNTGFDTHGGWTSDIRYVGCTSDASVTYPSDDGTRWGFLVGDTSYPNGSNNISFIGCIARNFLPYTRGGAGGGGDGCGFGVVDGCSNVTYRGCKVYDSTSGVYVLSQSGTAPITNVTIANCEFSRMTGNPIWINAGAAPGDVNGVVISNCEFIDGNAMSSVLLQGQSGNTIGNIVVKGCTWNMSTLVTGVYTVDARYVDDLVIDDNLFNKTNRGVALLNCAAAAVTGNNFKKLVNATDATNTIFDNGGNTSFTFAGNKIVGYFPTSWSTAPTSSGAFVEFVPAAKNYATGSRPSSSVAIGQIYDTTLNKPIWSTRAGVWKDATGATV